LFVSGAAFLLTRNLGLAIFAGMLAYSIFQKTGWLPGSNSGDPGARGGGRGRSGSGRMGLEEAYQVLGLSPGATRDQVQAAHRSLMKGFHPDQGGSNYIAAKVNEAKEVLMKHVPA
jgi:DnaJ domain